jgi:heme oxygenase
MRCLVSGEVTTDKINTSLITIYKLCESLEQSIKDLEKSQLALKNTVTELETATKGITSRIDNLVDKNGLVE